MLKMSHGTRFDQRAFNRPYLTLQQALSTVQAKVALAQILYTGMLFSIIAQLFKEVLFRVRIDIDLRACQTIGILTAKPMFVP